MIRGKFVSEFQERSNHLRDIRDSYKKDSLESIEYDSEIKSLNVIESAIRDGTSKKKVLEMIEQSETICDAYNLVRIGLPFVDEEMFDRSNINDAKNYGWQYGSTVAKYIVSRWNADIR